MRLALPTKKVLTLEAARLAESAAHACALANGWRVVIAVVDDGGHPLSLLRIDGTQASSVETAIGKARAAVLFKRPTRALEEIVNNGRFAFLNVAGSPVLLQGGLPIEAGGALLGAVGVSGVKASDDEIVARAGVDALLAALD